MSNFTTEVRYIVAVNSSGDQTIDERIAEAAPKIFNFAFPIWDENDRLNLESLILRHYYMREIGFETVGQWKLQLGTKMREIMPYYVELWNTTQEEYPLLQDVNIWETYTTERKGSFENKGSDKANTSSTDNTTAHANMEETGSNNKDTITSDLPQVLINTAATNLDYANGEAVEKSNHTLNTESSSGGETTGSTEATRNTEDSNSHEDTETHQRHRAGLQGGKTYTQLITEYRESLLQIPRMIIDDLADLFMGLW